MSMSLDIQPLVVRLEDTLATAMESLEKSGKGVVLLIEGAHGHLIQVLTDGDIRRLILGGASLDAPLSTVPRRQSFYVPVGTTGAEAIAFMDAHSIDQLPVVDGEGRPVDVFLRREMNSRIFLSSPHIGAEELQFVAEAFRTNMIAPLGPNVDAFETELAKRVGIAHAAALASGTAALHVGLRLLGVEAGDTVFCSSLTFVASANPILYQGATPVFIDSEPNSWNMSPTALERAFEEAKKSGRLPKAVLVVNLYGQSADMDRIVPLCDAFGVPMLEDAAESLGSTYRGRHSGTFGKLGVYSFNGNKIITTSGGGMLVSNDQELISRARYLSTQAREPALHYEHVEVGYNYRMSNVLAGIGRGQLSVLDSRVKARRAVFEHYRDALADVSAIEWMPEADSGMSNRWLTACTLRGGIPPLEVIKFLAKLDIEARPVWKPMHRQPLFAEAEYVSHGENYDCSGDLYDRGLCLPSGSNMTDNQIQRVCNAVRMAIAQYQ